MTSVEEALIDRINHLSVGLEGFLQEVNLLHQRLNILASPPMVPIVAQRGWNVMPEVIIPAGWNVMPPEPPLDILHGVTVAVGPPPQDIVENEPAFFLPREKEEWLNVI
ncbi:hypothetical protein HanXRQr2_Chr02g0059641 [Helianthus annuus]|uniref:Uncharacterized protein n=1 Tax=Helianthus annuus TaxID=4232 RepID=A0A9K3JN52_HELAN|nr:hypothetical protein HanXRQr2_Chr02g0059641 [Helianthus annuus]